MDVMQTRMPDWRDLFSISCIIPMYNEASNAAMILTKAEEFLDEAAKDWEIIVIESGSTDDTWPLLQQLTRNLPRVRIYHQERREGMGSALRLGYKHCTKDLVLHMEADCPYGSESIRRAVPILMSNEFVLGYRVGFREQKFRWSYHNMGRRDALIRHVYHIAYNLILRMVFDLHVRDVNFSFKIFKRDQIQNLSLRSNGWFIDAEIVLELRRQGVLPIEMPIEYRDRDSGDSTVSFFSPLHILIEMFSYLRK